MSAWGEADWTARDLSVEAHWLDDPERFVKPDTFIVGRDPGDEDDNRLCTCTLACDPRGAGGRRCREEDSC